jgi:hypothetical protein
MDDEEKGMNLDMNRPPPRIGLMESQKKLYILFCGVCFLCICWDLLGLDAGQVVPQCGNCVSGFSREMVLVIDVKTDMPSAIPANKSYPPNPNCSAIITIFNDGGTLPASTVVTIVISSFVLNAFCMNTSIV